jgi:hypothetical protein
MITSPPSTEVQSWPIDKLVFYLRNPRKNDAAVDRMCSSIREFGFKIPVLARSDGEVVDGHLRLKAARKLGSWPGGDTSSIPVILCDEWTPAQVKAFRLMVNRSVAWADWDEELLALELQELNAAEFDLDLTGFNPKEIDDLLALPDDVGGPPAAAQSPCPSSMGLPFPFDNSHACPSTRQTLDGLTATMYASSIINVSRRYPSRGFFRWNPTMACFSQSSSQKSRGTKPLCSFTLP